MLWVEYGHALCGGRWVPGSSRAESAVDAKSHGHREGGHGLTGSEPGGTDRDLRRSSPTGKGPQRLGRDAWEAPEEETQLWMDGTQEQGTENGLEGQAACGQHGYGVQARHCQVSVGVGMDRACGGPTGLPQVGFHFPQGSSDPEMGPQVEGVTRDISSD